MYPCTEIEISLERCLFRTREMERDPQAPASDRWGWLIKPETPRPTALVISPFCPRLPQGSWLFGLLQASIPKAQTPQSTQTPRCHVWPDRTLDSTTCVS